MSVPSPADGHGLLGLLVFVIFGFAVGYGLLSLCRFPDDRRNRALLAPMAATMLWALLGDILVRSGWTMAQVTWLLWPLAIALALVGAWALAAERASSLNRETLLIGSTAVLASTIIIAPAIEFGLFAYIGYGHVDTLYYNILAASYWENGIAPGNNLSFFFHQFAPALGLGNFRNHTLVLLGFLSPMWEAGEPVFVRSLYVFWMMVTGGLCGGYYFRIKYGSGQPRPFLTALYVGILVALGWASVPAIFGSWDNALFVPLLPLLAGLLYERPDWRVVIAIGLTVAYGFLTYIEGFPALGALAAPYLLIVHGRQPWRLVWRRYVMAGVIAMLALAPAAGVFFRYFSAQLQTVSAAEMPGGQFAHGLFDHPWPLPAWWAFGAEHMAPNTPAMILISAGLTALFLFGVLVAIRGRDPAVLSVFLLIPVIAYLWVVKHYSYGTYKMLSFGWWLIADLTVAGAASLYFYIPATRSRATALTRAAVSAVVAITIGGGSLLALCSRWQYYFPDFSTTVIPSAYELAAIRDQARRLPQSDAMFARSLAQVPLRAVWLAYALRSTDVRMFFATRPDYALSDDFLWTKPGLPDALMVGAEERKISERALIDSPRFALVPWRRTAWIARLDTPNGAEEWGTWLGTRAIELSVVASEPSHASLDFDAEPGPSKPETTERTVVLTVNGREASTARVMERQRVTFKFELGRGTTELTVRCVDRPTVARISNGDERPLLVAVRDLTLRAFP